MNKSWILCVGLLPCNACSQSGVYAYLPAQNGFLKLKSAQVESTVIGPVVRTCTDFVYEPPPANAPLVSFNFELPQSSTLGGFGYFEGNKFVQARLQVRDKLNSVNSEIGGGLRQSGLIDQSSPSVYRCDIHPLETGAELRIRVWAVQMVQPGGEKLLLPRPQVEVPILAGTPVWQARTVPPASLSVSGDTYSLGAARPMDVVAQKFSDGRYYVAGYVHTKHVAGPDIEIKHAYFESMDGKKPGSDVTAKVTDMVRQHQFFVWASDTMFGDPLVNVHKRLRVIARIDGVERTLITPQNETLNLLGLGGGSVPPVIRGLHSVRTVFEDPGTVAFFGWCNRPNLVTASFHGAKFETRARNAKRGSDTARLWAQQMVASSSVAEPEKVLAFSLRYGILSNVTAMVTVTGTPKASSTPMIGLDVGHSKHD